MAQINLEKLKEAIEKDAKDPNGVAATFAKKRKLEQQRTQKLHSYILSLSTIEVDDFIQKLISKHTDVYKGRCISNGYEPFPINLMNLLFKTAEYNGEVDNSSYDQNDPLYSDWLHTTYKYFNYYFQIILAQGSTIVIYNKDKEYIFSI